MLVWPQAMQDETGVPRGVIQLITAEPVHAPAFSVQADAQRASVCASGSCNETSRSQLEIGVHSR